MVVLEFGLPMARKVSRRSPPLRGEVRRLREEVRGQRAIVDQCRHDLDTQFTRIAQIQAELDEVRGAWVRLPRPRVKRRS
jgi:hypothetical protein